MLGDGLPRPLLAFETHAAVDTADPASVAAVGAALREANARREAGSQQPIGPSQVRLTEAQLSETVWINRVGTFGVGSAGYWWRRVGALLVRLSHYLPPRHLDAHWLFLYADDGDATAGGERFETSFLSPFPPRCARNALQVVENEGRPEMGMDRALP